VNRKTNWSSGGGQQRRWVIFPLLFVAAFVAILAGSSLYFHAAAPAGYAWWPWAPFGWFLIFPVFFIAFFALRFFWWGPWGGRSWYYHGESAIEILGERFARGEITKEQFEQMRKDLAQT
jgi:putative membrane protein